MEKTLEVRWFFKGFPSTTIEHWFKFECPGKLVNVEVRKDKYVIQPYNSWARSLEPFANSLDAGSINLKLRNGSLELKLRQQQLETYRFNCRQYSHFGRGNIEQWYKFSQQELKKLNFDPQFNDIVLIGVEKKRQQKIERGVKSELTKLGLDSDRPTNCQRWWTIAFEMTQNDGARRSLAHFKEVIEQACKTYPQSQLLATNSYGYSSWLLKGDRTIFSQENSSS